MFGVGWLGCDAADWWGYIGTLWYSFEILARVFESFVVLVYDLCFGCCEILSGV